MRVRYQSSFHDTTVCRWRATWTKQVWPTLRQRQQLHGNSEQCSTGGQFASQIGCMFKLYKATFQSLLQFFALKDELLKVLPQESHTTYFIYSCLIINFCTHTASTTSKAACSADTYCSQSFQKVSHWFLYWPVSLYTLRHMLIHTHTYTLSIALTHTLPSLTHTHTHTHTATLTCAFRSVSKHGWLGSTRLPGRRRVRSWKNWGRTMRKCSTNSALPLRRLKWWLQRWIIKYRVCMLIDTMQRIIIKSQVSF